jgi:hypothetical protein
MSILDTPEIERAAAIEYLEQALELLEQIRNDSADVRLYNLRICLRGARDLIK